ncbi:Hypothetical predicted protein [Mytilus galloprovincialis]|uniref:SUEL-type lectin domain-containing protein n=1 Tax=Mytilus galloprovincialis TaxID=29158 RepID=A0A8B6DWZ0_MYTGA|nr:Hypothetical predicted protein [Mytilus galloprovincialis]
MFKHASVAVGVTVGLITIVGVIVVYIWFVKRKVSDDKQNTTNQRDENKYSIGNQNTAIPSDSNYEMLTTDQESRSYDELNQNFRKQSSRDQPDRNNKEMESEYIIPCPVTQHNKSKQENEDQTVNHVESNKNGTGIREHTKTSLSNSANYFIVFEPNGSTFEKRLCENSTIDLTCPDGNAIEDINIAFHDIGNACSLTNDGNMGTEAMNSTSYSSCIGHNSCVLTDKMINVSHLVADKTWKLNIDYHCIRTDQLERNNSKPEIAVCPYNMESVRCARQLNKVEIQSVEVMQYSSFCKKHNLDQQCTEFIQKNVQKSCSFNNTCQPIIWTKSVNTWDDCIRIPKFVNISFSCKAITSERPSQDETSDHGSLAITTPLQDETSVQGRIGNIVYCPSIARGNNIEGSIGKHDGSDYQQGIYSRAVDTVYDSASHSRQNTITDQTYDHAFGPTTEDDYDIAKH